MKSFDAWARELSDELRKKEQKVEIKPEDLYTHKDLMRGEYGKVTTDGEEINSAADKCKYNPKTVKVWWDEAEMFERKEYAKLQEQARLLKEELDNAPLYMFGHNCTSMETVESISPAPNIDYNGASSKNRVDSFNVGDLHRATHDNCGQFMIDCYNNGIICQIDSVDSTFVTLVRVE